MKIEIFSIKIALVFVGTWYSATWSYELCVGSVEPRDVSFYVSRSTLDLLHVELGNMSEFTQILVTNVSVEEN